MVQMKNSITPTEKNIRRSSIATVLWDILIILSLVVCLFIYVFRNNTDSYDKNIKNISDIATATSQMIRSAIDNTSEEIIGAYKYCDGKSLTEILDYLSLVNGTDSEYQVLKLDETVSTDLYHVYCGYSTKKDSEGNYQEIAYKDNALSFSLHNYSLDQNGTVAFSQSFNNKTDSLRYFAVFCGINVSVDGETQRYYLLKPQKESKLLNQAQTFTQYRNVSVAICYPDGKYLACDEGFRSDNFYDYLYKYNGLSLDEKNELRQSVNNDPNGNGTLEYINHQKQNCVFAYAACGDTESWEVIVSVPTSEFVKEELLSFFPLTIISFLVVLLAFNIIRLLSIVNKLRQSMKREIVANASKSSFLSRMSHEIRTPLNAVIGYNTIAQNEMAEAKDEVSRKQAEMKVMDCLSKSEIASKHLLTIINDVLDMSAIEGGKITIAHDRFDFKGLITSLTMVFYSQAKAKGVNFEVIFDSMTDEWFVGDSLRVNQILTNLLSNAIKFTPDGGSVMLKINQAEVVSDKAQVHFEVTDTGIGMTADYLTHIWAPFEQADSSISRRFGGSGLGLSITKSLVELMKGNIVVKSTQGEGTTFEVDLAFEMTEQPSTSEAYDFKKINALVVDDDPNTCDYIRLLFNRYGAKCAAVTSGEEALEAVSEAKEKGSSYSLCFVDWKMPGMDGVETIKRIRDISGADLPIVVLTAYDFSELLDKTHELGDVKFISKPLFQSSLFDLLVGICGGEVTETLESGDEPDFGGAKILLAEDNPMNMEIATAMLSMVGLTAESAWNGKEAVELFEAAPEGTYMAILMDIQMPIMDGYAATRAIRASAHPSAGTIPIIAMTAEAFAENVAEALAAGMNEHIAKPIDAFTLFDTLKRYK